MGIAYVKTCKIEYFKYIVNYIEVKLVKSINNFFFFFQAAVNQFVVLCIFDLGSLLQSYGLITINILNIP